MEPYETGRRRKNQIHFFLSDKEVEALHLRMEKCKMNSLSDYCRNMIINGYVIVIGDAKEVKEFNIELGRIGNNVNQIARVANTSGSVSKESIDAMLGYMDKIWQLQRSILSGTQQLQSTT